MYRRSNSSSHIPLPKTNLFGTNKDSKPKRSQSTSRLSQRDSVASVSRLRPPQRPSSLDRKSSTVGLLRVTPLHRPGARSGSLQRTTPTSAISQRTHSSRGTTPTSVRKDYVSIQKLATDKKWVAEQYVKVQNFIMGSGLFNVEVVNCNNIRPPSINNFIYVTGVMLLEIFPKVKIDKDNFKEVIPAKLKVLRYPGTLTNSVLKTISTMHSWPQVMGMWSWLIDKVNLSNDSYDNIPVASLGPEERPQFFIKQTVAEFILDRYKIFNEPNKDCTEEVQEINDTYVKSLAECLDVDFEKFQQLQEDVEKKKACRDKEKENTERLRAENKKMAAEIEENKTEIADFEEKDPIEAAELEKELQLLQSTLSDQEEAVQSVDDRISELRKAVREQSCSYQEKLSLLRQIEELKRAIQAKRNKIEFAREIKNKFDHRLTTEISKIQSLVTQWNCSLMEISIKKPHLKKLQLREKAFHNPDFLTELERVLDYKETVETEVAEALIKINNDLTSKEQKRRKIEEEIQELTEINRRTNEEYMTVMEKMEEIAKEMKNVLNEREAMKSSYIQQIKELQNDDKLEVLTRTIEDLKSKKGHLEVEVRKFGPKMLSFFIEMHNQVVTITAQMDGILAKLAERIENRRMNILEKQRQMLEILKKLKTP